MFWPGRLLSRRRTTAYLSLSVLALLAFWSLLHTRQELGATGWGILDIGGLAGNPKDRESRLRLQFQKEYEKLGRSRDAGAIYGNTLMTVIAKDERRLEHEAALRPSERATSFSHDAPYIFDPYPRYNSAEWRTSHAEHVACPGPAVIGLSDISVFKGHPRDFPAPSFGSYALLDIDPDLCFERETRLGQYGLADSYDGSNQPMDWDAVRWGELQSNCVGSNKARFDLIQRRNEFLSAYQGLREAVTPNTGATVQPFMRREQQGEPIQSDGPEGETEPYQTEPHEAETPADAPGVANMAEPRTAVLLRSYTGKQYSDNDKQVIRSLITELSLRTGGEFQVFLLVHAKVPYDIWASEDTYRYAIEAEVPQEFWDIAILWNDAAVQELYPKLDPSEAANVHNAQWLSVQKFMQEFREFDYVWNWELDARLTGHHYDMLTKIADFARKQPRKGLWERNERFYIPSLHGDYDTDFRQAIEALYPDDSVWGAAKVPFVNPVGPAPPVASPGEDNYEWGVGEEADLITLSPMFNPVNSSWVLGRQVWGYSDSQHPREALPRRATIVTHSRISRKLLDIMHVENLRGNHVASEMTPQTVALLHGLKAVYAPMPVFFDRPWHGSQLARWFNGGPRGQSGGFGSAMGWGREQRFQGSTWYYRSDPPQRLYNNWLGYEDTALGGAEWERAHGRTCLPAMFLHPVKDSEATEPGHFSKSNLPYS